jgi:Na+/H+ antiporter NhaD/arsenite permease-like protein
MKCIKCSKDYTSEYKFCPHCGANVKNGKKELSDSEKAANKVLNFLAVIIVLAVILFFWKNYLDSELAVYKSKKQLEIYKSK